LYFFGLALQIEQTPYILFIIKYTTFISTSTLIITINILFYV